MSLDNMDKIQSMLENEIHNKKNELVTSLEELEEERETNQFLKEIAEDYKKYNKIIVDQKKKQVEELTKILDYLDELIETQVITKHTLSHTQNEQKRTVNEIKELRKELKALEDSV